MSVMCCSYFLSCDRVKEEVREVLGTNLEVQLSVNDVMQLTYLEKVLQCDKMSAHVYTCYQ